MEDPENAALFLCWHHPSDVLRHRLGRAGPADDDPWTIRQINKIMPPAIARLLGVAAVSSLA